MDVGSVFAKSQGEGTADQSGAEYGGAVDQVRHGKRSTVESRKLRVKRKKEKKEKITQRRRGRRGGAERPIANAREGRIVGLLAKSRFLA
jgi:hypothetical protein